MAVKPEVILGDITTLAVDVIVNAANPSLLGGGGVDGAIHRAAGPELLAACKIVRQQQGECAPGHAVITTAGQLPASAVIHAVGPVWHGGDRQEAELLADAYKNSLQLRRRIATALLPSRQSVPACTATLSRLRRR
nr:macro domain-containing protein [Raoultella sp. NCTC 9187]